MSAPRSRRAEPGAPERAANARPRRRRAGVTLLEAVGFLTAATLIISGTLAIYDQAQLGVRTNQTIVAVGVMSIAVRALHANIGTYGSDDGSQTDLTRLLVNSNNIPPGMLITEDSPDVFTVRTPFGGRTEVAAGGTDGGTRFWVEVEGIADDVCINIVTRSVAGGYHGLVSVAINPESDGALFERAKGAVPDDPLAPRPSLTSPGQYPVSPTHATLFCNQGTPGAPDAGKPQNTLRWLYE